MSLCSRLLLLLVNVYLCEVGMLNMLTVSERVNIYSFCERV